MALHRWCGTTRDHFPPNLTPGTASVATQHQQDLNKETALVLEHLDESRLASPVARDPGSQSPPHQGLPTFRGHTSM